MRKTRRDSLIQLIHVAKSKLGLDDDAYRAILSAQGRAGAESSKDLSVKELEAVLAYLKRMGFVAQGKRPGQAHKPLAESKEAIERKIGWQLRQLDKDWNYAYGVARHIHPDVERFEFLTAQQLGDVSSALERTLRYQGR